MLGGSSCVTGPFAALLLWGMGGSPSALLLGWGAQNWSGGRSIVNPHHPNIARGAERHRGGRILYSDLESKKPQKGGFCHGSIRISVTVAFHSSALCRPTPLATPIYPTPDSPSMCVQHREIPESSKFFHRFMYFSCISMKARTNLTVLILFYTYRRKETQRGSLNIARGEGEGAECPQPQHPNSSSCRLFFGSKTKLKESKN